MDKLNCLRCKYLCADNCIAVGGFCTTIQAAHCQKLKEFFDDVENKKLVSVVHGRWIGLEYDSCADGCPVYDKWECSMCGEEHNGEECTLPNYCPRCGAKMDGEANDDEI